MKVSNYDNIFKNRIIIAIFFIVILFLIIIARIYYLQIHKYDFYKIESQANRYDFKSILPIRGKIFDRNGIVLAENKMSFLLRFMPNKNTKISKILLALENNKIITKEEIENFKKKLKKTKIYSPIVIARNISDKKMARLLVNNLPVEIEVYPTFTRHYPYGELASHIIGYTGGVNSQDLANLDKSKYSHFSTIGKIGIEKQYENLLSGYLGREKLEKNAKGGIINSKAIISPKPGRDIYLTIDKKLQKVAKDLLDKKRGAIVMLDVNKGDLLAMASSPNYNPNDFSMGISSKLYRKLINSKDKPLLNRAIQGQYPPGSTIKPIIALASLEKGNIDRKTKIYCPGYFRLPNSKHNYRDWKRKGHGMQRVEDAIAESCDVFFYKLAHNLGIDNIAYYLNLFNFGRLTGIDLLGEKKGIVPSKEWKKQKFNKPWYRGETVISGIGQGFITATPLQIAISIAGIANRGSIPQPKLLLGSSGYNESDLQLKKSNKTSLILIKDDHLQTIIDGMKKTIYGAKGTGRRLNDNLKYTLAGKTGTAQVFSLQQEEEYNIEQIDESLIDHALFVGFAPIEKPQVVIAVVVENAGSGSRYAAPIAKKVLDSYFADKNK